MDAYSKVIPAREFMKLNHMSEARFYNRLRRGEFYAVKVGRRTFVPEDEAQRFRAALPRLGRSE